MKDEIVLEANELQKVLKEVFEVKDAVFPLKITGGSMSPFLGDRRDTALLTAPVGPYKKGDILFYKRSNGRLILHRVVKKDGNKLYFAGDNQTDIEGPLDESAVIACCHSVIRKGRKISEKNIIWRIFVFLWIAVLPFRRKILCLYSKIRRGDKR